MTIFKAKTVGIKFHKTSTPIRNGMDVYVMEDDSNGFDNDAIGVYTKDDELIGYVANSQTTLSPNNRKNGNKSATELRFELDFDNKKYGAVVDRAFSSCVYIQIDSNKWQHVDESIVDSTDSMVMELKTQIDALIIENTMLKNRLDIIESIIGGGK